VLQGYKKKQITLMQAEKLVAGQQCRKGIQGDFYQPCIEMGIYGTVRYIPISPEMKMALISS